MKALHLKILSVTAGTLLGSLSMAQDFTLNPLFGSVDLNAGFLPDPEVVSVLAGGNLQASSANSSCNGYVTDNPSYQLYYEAGSSPLGIYTNADFDTTILINTPNGDWVCNDDHSDLDNLNAGYYFDSPSSGRYDIWVGSYSDTNAYREAVLAISEYSTTSWETDLQPSTPGLTLNSGFGPDPYLLEVFAGGRNQASNLSGGCSGYVGERPTTRLNFTPGTTLGLGFYIISDLDTTIAVRAPNGSWNCSDDHSELGLDAGYYFASPQAGSYDVYVGTYSEGNAGMLVNLAITEYSESLWLTELPDDAPPAPSAPDISLSDGIPEVTIFAGGFTPDPFGLEVVAGGDLSASSYLDNSCTGYVTENPTYSLNYFADSQPLGIYINSNVDTTLAILDPDLNWYCSDDYTGLSLNGGYYFNAPLDGYYEIYVGTYSQPNAGAPAALVITELADSNWRTDMHNGNLIPLPAGADVFVPAPPTPDGEIQFGSKL